MRSIRANAGCQLADGWWPRVISGLRVGLRGGIWRLASLMLCSRRHSHAVRDSLGEVVFPFTRGSDLDAGWSDGVYITNCAGQKTFHEFGG